MRRKIFAILVCALAISACTHEPSIPTFDEELTGFSQSYSAKKPEPTIADRLFGKALTLTVIEYLCQDYLDDKDGYSRAHAQAIDLYVNGDHTSEEATILLNNLQSELKRECPDRKECLMSKFGRNQSHEDIEYYCSRSLGKEQIDILDLLHELSKANDPAAFVVHNAGVNIERRH